MENRKREVSNRICLYRFVFLGDGNRELWSKYRTVRDLDICPCQHHDRTGVCCAWQNKHLSDFSSVQHYRLIPKKRYKMHVKNNEKPAFLTQNGVGDRSLSPNRASTRQNLFVQVVKIQQSKWCEIHTLILRSDCVIPLSELALLFRYEIIFLS